jgi:hypothetical protein
MNAYDVADALEQGRDLALAKLRRSIVKGDDGDQLYVWLYQLTTGRCTAEEAREAIRVVCGHPATAEAWLAVASYADAPTGSSYARLVGTSGTSMAVWATVLRLSPLVLVGRDRRRFSCIVRDQAAANPELREELEDVAAALKRPGPTRLQARRAAARRVGRARVR